MKINKLIKFSLFFLLSNPSILIDIVNINKITFINAKGKNKYLQLTFKNKMLLTIIGPRKAPRTATKLNLIIFLLLIGLEISLIIETEFIVIIAKDILSII